MGTTIRKSEKAGLNDKMGYLLIHLGHGLSLFADMINPTQLWKIGKINKNNGSMDVYFVGSTPTEVIDSAYQYTETWQRKSKQCTNKLRHFRMDSALHAVDVFRAKALMIGNDKEANRMRPYFCPHCHGWHIGKMKSDYEDIN